ncbi:MAG: orotate phosphoribosyltransferase [Nitrospinota bacterium]|nr:orotate phosphoribosyltransferase [Nitrospinota bacterium]
MSIRQDLIDILKAQSYEEREVTLSSGKKSNFYFDGKMTTTDPYGAWLVGKLIFEAIRDLKPDGVGGMSIGADPITTAVTIVSHLEGQPITGFLIRKEPKKHGKRLSIEGGYNLKEGSRVVMVEDVVTTGGSTLKAIEKSEEAGFKVIKVISIVDRQEGGREAIEAAGYSFDSLFTKRDIVTPL